ncbi:hypothetical protein PAECIP111891_06993 [Paenibacillus allorhizoplanae]|uniref:Uncharacterized protein n=1 Tax=Paenibacillus allorhizoplanae TaxID=2905648 RepID=A0ABN8H6S1_9BACL|nr:hypothetical protein PAECIP111891_06993 [Paenibacillus allorhizoplanae]
MMSKRKQIWIISITSFLVIYLLFFPNLTAELAVRKHLFFSLPIKASVFKLRGKVALLLGEQNYTMLMKYPNHLFG